MGLPSPKPHLGAAIHNRPSIPTPPHLPYCKVGVLSTAPGGCLPIRGHVRGNQRTIISNLSLAFTKTEVRGGEMAWPSPIYQTYTAKNGVPTSVKSGFSNNEYKISLRPTSRRHRPNRTPPLPSLTQPCKNKYIKQREKRHSFQPSVCFSLGFLYSISLWPWMLGRAFIFTAVSQYDKWEKNVLEGQMLPGRSSEGSGQRRKALPLRIPLAPGAHMALRTPHSGSLLSVSTESISAGAIQSLTLKRMWPLRRNCQRTALKFVVLSLHFTCSISK